MRHLVDRHTRLVSDARTVLDRCDGAVVAVAAWVAGDELRRATEELERIDVLRLGETTDKNLRLAAVQAGGYLTAADLLGVEARTLDALPGVGEATARGVVAAVDQLARAAVTLRPLRIGIDRAGLPTPVGADQLLALLHRVQRLRPLVEPHRQALLDYVRLAGAAVTAARPFRYAARAAFARPSTRRTAHAAVEALRAWEPRPGEDDAPIRTTVDRLLSATAGPDPGVFDLVADYTARSAAYYATLSGIAPQVTDALAARGLLPFELVERVDAHPLDTSRLRAELRGYQGFGARFALEQGRVLLGDEMGLGKTVQALAVMAHLAAHGHSRFLVVCPASLLATWERETTAHTSLPVHRLHGDRRGPSITAWREAGGVGVTTFEGLAHVGPATADVGLVVVDEAQCVKNPKTARARAVTAWTQAVTRVLLLSGTPMDNRLEDFVALVELLHPGLSDTLPSHLGLMGSEAFRRAVAPVYLRRNQVDVLVELPDVIASDDWVDLGPGEEAAYREAVASGNLMAMRQAAWASPGGAMPAKLERLLEIVDEARDELRSTIVFSFFHATLDVVTAALRQRGVPVHGPLTGAVPVDKRAALVDSFLHDTGSVLVTQVSVGGTGLNLQAASVVVLCEPQLVPSLEDQAVARAHRMGQVRTVRAHRLLAEDGVDERIVELLTGKRQIFDGYVRRSSLAETARGATDVSQGDLAREVVAAEQARLGYGPWWDEVEDDASVGPDA